MSKGGKRWSRVEEEVEQRGAGGWKWSDDLPVVAVIKQW